MTVDQEHDCYKLIQFTKGYDYEDVEVYSTLREQGRLENFRIEISDYLRGWNFRLIRMDIRWINSAAGSMDV